MSDTHRIVHVAADRGQAHAVRNLLAGYGIAAHVRNDLAGGDIHVGSATSHHNAPSVVVSEEDAEQARQIIEDAASAIEQGLASPELSQLEAEIGEDHQWPACPHCSRPRLTSCPVCETAGTHFAKAFMPEVLPQDEGTTADPSDALMVLCPTCDEPFAPQFPARCEWCSHRFADGYEPRPVDHQTLEQFSATELGGRVLIATAGLVAFVAALFGWFYYILH